MINYISYEYGSDKAPAKAGDMFASSLNMGQSQVNYSSEQVDNETIIAGDTPAEINTNLAWTPVIPGTVYVNITTNTSAAVGRDDGKGYIVSEDGTKTLGTIDYTTGAISTKAVAESTGVRKVDGIADAKEGTATYCYDNQQVFVAGTGKAGTNTNMTEFGRATNIPEVNLKITSLPVVAKSRKMKAVYAFDAAYELEKEYGQDIDTLLATEVAGEIAHEIDMEIANDIFKMANAGTPITWSKTQPVGVNLLDHYDSFYAKLLEGANVIFGATRKVQPNFMVCGLGVLSVIQAARNFTPSGVQAIGPHFAGTYGIFKVFVSPDYASNQFVLGYKGTSFMDSGMFYCPYMPILSTDLLMTDDFAGRKGWATMYAKKMVNNRLYLQGFITD